MSDYHKLVDRVVERAEELYDESKMDDDFNSMEKLAGKCVYDAMGELVVSEEDKWTIIQEVCTDADELYYDGNLRCPFSTPCCEFYDVCLYRLTERLT